MQKIVQLVSEANLCSQKRHEPANNDNTNKGKSNTTKYGTTLDTERNKKNNYTNFNKKQLHKIRQESFYVLIFSRQLICGAYFVTFCLPFPQSFLSVFFWTRQNNVYERQENVRRKCTTQMKTYHTTVKYRSCREEGGELGHALCEQWICTRKVTTSCSHGGFTAPNVTATCLQ